MNINGKLSDLFGEFTEELHPKDIIGTPILDENRNKIGGVTEIKNNRWYGVINTPLPIPKKIGFEISQQKPAL